MPVMHYIFMYFNNYNKTKLRSLSCLLPRVNPMGGQDGITPPYSEMANSLANLSG